MPESVQATLARQAEQLKFISKEVATIQEDMKGMRNAVRGMLFSLIVGLIVMIGGFFLTQAGAQ